MSGDMTSSIVEEGTASATLESNNEDILKAKMVTIAPPTNDVPIQHKNVNGHFNFNNIDIDKSFFYTVTDNRRQY